MDESSSSLMMNKFDSIFKLTKMLHHLELSKTPMNIALQIIPRRVFAFRNFFQQEECKEIIARAEKAGFQEAPVNMGKTFGEIMQKSIRNNTRIVYDDFEFSHQIFEKTKPLIETEESLQFQEKGMWKAVSMNERFRFYKYTTGQKFVKHYDGTVFIHSRLKSIFTFLIYLNQNFTGGETKLYNEDLNEFVIKPETGLAVAFLHQTLHESVPIETGTKYVLRTDIMYEHKD